MALTVLNKNAAVTQFTASPYQCDGAVMREPIANKDGAKMDISLEACGSGFGTEPKSAIGSVRLFMPGPFQLFNAGDKVKFLARLNKPRNFKNPGSFDYSKYLLTQNINHTASLVGPGWIVKTGEEKQDVFSKTVGKLRRKIDAAITASVRGDAAGLLKAVIIGKKSEISNEMQKAFSHAGVAHLLAISGLHVGYAAMAVFLLVRLILILCPNLFLNWPAQRISSIIGLFAVWFYVAIAAFPISAVRAAIMLTVLMISYFCLRRHDLLSSLSAAVFVILLLFPLSVYSVSFQLSVSCVFAIIVLTPIFMKPFERSRGRKICQLAAVTLAATLGSAPLVALNFHFISVLGLAVNLMVVPFAGVVLMPLSLMAALFTIIAPPLSFTVWKMAGHSAGILIQFIEFVDHYKAPFIMFWAPDAWEVFLAYSLIAAVIFLRYLPYKRTVLSCIFAAVIIDIMSVHVLPFMKKQLEVVFLDVGHGDSIFVRFPDGYTMLVDGGGIKGSEFDIGENVVCPALLRMGVHHVDEIILSHPHYDHYRGLSAVAEMMKTPLLYTNGANVPPDEQDEWQNFLGRIKAAGTRIQQLREGAGFNIAHSSQHGGAKIDIYAPDSKSLNLLDPNNTSLVVRLEYGEKSILLTGDLMTVGERLLIDSHADIESDVLKTGHHGSQTSTSAPFLEAVSPKIAVITVGEHDQYGVPDDIVLDRLGAIGAKIYRTDRDGAITIKTDGKLLQVDTFVKNPL